MRKQFAAIILTASSVFAVTAQDPLNDESVILEDLVEYIARGSEDEPDYTTLFADLTYCLEHPLDLNTVSDEELEKLHLLTDFQITSLRQYIMDNGPMLSVYELPLVYGFSPRLAQMISPFVTVTPAEADRSFPSPAKKKAQQHQLLLRASGVLQERRGYREADDSTLAANPNAYYSGSPLKIYSRYTFRSGKKIQAGLTAEKDAGEDFLGNSNPYGFDFYSAHIEVSDVWKVKNLVIGDFQAEAGQGLTLWSGLSFGKSPEVINIRKKNQGISPYTSVNENRYFRGISSTFSVGRLDLTTFLSRKKIDANITGAGPDDDASLAFSSFQTSGSHAIPREIEDEKSITETVAGGNLSCRMNNGKIGFSLVNYRFDGSMIIRDEPWSAFYFNGSGGMNAGVDYQFAWKRLAVFGETGMNDRKALGTLNGAVFSLSSMFSVSVLHRFYDKRFYALYGNAFSESAGNSNEHGLYTGVTITPAPRWTLSGSIDAYTYPWLRQQVSVAPSSGYDYQLQADYQYKEAVSAYLRYQRDAGPENLRSDIPGINDVVTKQTDRLRINIAYKISPVLEFQNRLELSFYSKYPDRQEGYLFSHDVLYRPSENRWSLTFRYCLFDTDGYESRIYLYEHDVLYAFRIASFHGKGIRTYVNARYTLSRNLDLWLKIGDTFYPGKESVGSGLDEIDGSNQTTVTFQLRLRID